MSGLFRSFAARSKPFPSALAESRTPSAAAVARSPSSGALPRASRRHLPGRRSVIIKKLPGIFAHGIAFFRRAAYTGCERSSILGSARKGRARIDGAPSPYARGNGINKGRFARRLWRCGRQGKTCKLLIHAQHIGRCGYWERAGAHQAPCRLDARRQSSGRCQTRMPAAKHRTSAAERKGFGKTSPAHSARLLTSKLYQTCMRPSGKKSRTFIPNPYLRPRCGRARRPGGAAGRGRAGAALMRPPDSPADGGGGRTPRRLFAVRFIAANGTDRATGDEKLCAIRKEPRRSFRSICFNAHSTRRCFRGES